MNLGTCPSLTVANTLHELLSFAVRIHFFKLDELEWLRGHLATSTMNQLEKASIESLKQILCAEMKSRPNYEEWVDKTVRAALDEPAQLPTFFAEAYDEQFLVTLELDNGVRSITVHTASATKVIDNLSVGAELISVRNMTDYPLGPALRE